MSEETIEFADSIWVNFKPGVQKIGPMTEVRSFARIAAVNRMALGDTLKFKLGDQIEWEIVLSGSTTVDQRMIEQAIDRRIR
jgi:hypothetical protein